MRVISKYNAQVETAYFPQRLLLFSPYPEDHRYHNLLTAERDIIQGVEVLNPPAPISLTNAEQLFDYEFNNALDCLSDDIFIFKLPTGIGKSRRIKELDEVLLAFPTNELKLEQFQSRTEHNNAHFTPPFPVFQDAQLNESLERLLKAGFIKQVHRILWDLNNGACGGVIDQLRAQDYVRKIQQIKKEYETVFTTHSRAIHTQFEHDTVIFDEDPLALLIDVKTLKIADLKKIGNQSISSMFGDKSTTLLTLQRYLEGVPAGQVYTLPSTYRVDISSEAYTVMHTDGVDSNIVKFLESNYFYKDENNRDLIHFVKAEDLPAEKKVIIMSATVPVEIYKKLYGDRVQVIDITEVTHTGKITQHTKYSYSRNSLARHTDELNQKLPAYPTITFKSFNKLVQGAAPDMWFGNCSGYNQYTGKSINVVGTPHRHNAQYLLLAQVMGIDINQVDKTFTRQTVEWNGFRFSFNTFSEESLREIQLSLIESDLIQAAGRARALREDVEVHIYSNLPLRISQQFSND